MLARCCLLFAAAAAEKPAPPTGPYEVHFQSVNNVKVMDITDRTIGVWTPKGVEGQKFPLISYSHGFAGGWWWEPIAYNQVLRGLAEFGYVVIAPQAALANSELRRIPDRVSFIGFAWNLTINQDVGHFCHSFLLLI